MRANWNITSLIATSDLVELSGLPWPLELRPHATARSMRLRLNERAGRLVLTFPKRVNRKSALDWVARQSEWAHAQVARIGDSRPFTHGQPIPFRGTEILLVWDKDSPRTPHFSEGQLIAGGPPESFSGRIERYLRSLARQELSAHTDSIARIAGVSVRSVSIGDATSRWGSCSASGAIRYNWRLILAPPHVLEWVVAHEVAHRRHMNHGPDFRRLEAQLYTGDVTKARALLRKLGPGLKRVGLTV